MKVTLRVFSLLLLFLFVSPDPTRTSAGTGSPPDAPHKICPLPIGSPVPPLTLQTLDAEPFDLYARLRVKPTVLIYFRGGW